MYWEADRDSRYSEARRGIGGIRGHWGLLGVQGVSRGHFGGIRGCRGVRGVLEWQLDWEPDHIGPQSRVPAPNGSPGGVTYLANAKQVTEMSSAGYYIHLELYFMTVFIFVFRPPHHIFLHTILRNVIWIIFSADQFMHILT